MQTLEVGATPKLVTLLREEEGRDEGKEATLFIASKQTNCFASRSQKEREKKKKDQRECFWKSISRSILVRVRGEEG